MCKRIYANLTAQKKTLYRRLNPKSKKARRFPNEILYYRNVYVGMYIESGK